MIPMAVPRVDGLTSRKFRGCNVADELERSGT
jgi:hypothetical protein